MPFGKGKKKPAASYSRTGESRTTLGDGALDFRVRNGNGYDNSSMATGKREITEFRITNCEYSVESQPKLGTKENYDSNEMRGLISHSSEVQRFGRFGRFGRSMEISKPSLPKEANKLSRTSD